MSGTFGDSYAQTVNSLKTVARVLALCDRDPPPPPPPWLLAALSLAPVFNECERQKEAANEYRITLQDEYSYRLKLAASAAFTLAEETGRRIDMLCGTYLGSRFDVQARADLSCQATTLRKAKAVIDMALQDREPVMEGPNRLGIFRTEIQKHISRAHRAHVPVMTDQRLRDNILAGQTDTINASLAAMSMVQMNLAMDGVQTQLRAARASLRQLCLLRAFIDAGSSGRERETETCLERARNLVALAHETFADVRNNAEAYYVAEILKIPPFVTDTKPAL